MLSRIAWLGAASGALKELAAGLGGDGSVGKLAHKGKRCSPGKSAAKKWGMRCDRSCMGFSASHIRAGGTPVLSIIRALDTE